MAKTERIGRKFNMTVPSLCMFVSNLVITLQGDQSDLEQFGITTEKINELKAEGDVLEVKLNDDAYVGNIMIAVDNCDEIAEALKDDILQMGFRVRAEYGAGSSQYKSLGIDGVQNFGHDRLVAASKRVHSFCTANLAELTAWGLTQALLDSLMDRINSFEQAVNEVADRKSARLEATRERMELANSVYEKASLYCSIAKKYYGPRDPARYKHYLIYGSKNEKMEDVPVV